MGHGDPFWSAYFDNVENRLGFHDPFANVNGPLAYLVCGWHSRHADDPIGEGLRTYSQFEARLTQLGWEIPSADLRKAFQSSNDTIRAAALSGVDTREARFTSSRNPWPCRPPTPRSSPKSSPPSRASPTRRRPRSTSSAPLRPACSWPPVILAGLHPLPRRRGRHRMARTRHRSRAEWPDSAAKSADLLPLPREDQHRQHDGRSARRNACRQQRHDRRSRLLEAVLLDSMQDLDQPDGAARIDARLHAKGFGSLPGGDRHHDYPPAPVRHRAAARPRPQSHRPRRFHRPAAPKKTGVTNSWEERTRCSASSTLPPADPSRIRAAHVPQRAMEAAIDWACHAELHRTAPTRPLAVDPDPDPVDTDSASAPSPASSFLPIPSSCMQGGNRSFKHGADNLYSENGLFPAA